MRVSAGFLLIGRGERIGTSDHRNPIAVRYQAALRPVLDITLTVCVEQLRNLFERPD